jgi:hypothetical protein
MENTSSTNEMNKRKTLASKLKHGLIETGKIALTLGVLGAGFIGIPYSCMKFSDAMEGKRKAPSLESINVTQHAVQTTDYTNNGNAMPVYLWDTNKNGIVDTLSFGGRANWYSDESSESFRNKRSRKMTPALQKAATEARDANYKLQIMLIEEALRQDAQGKK